MLPELAAWINTRIAAVNAGERDAAALADDLEDGALRVDPSAAFDPDVARFRARIAEHVVPGPVAAAAFSATEDPTASHLAFTPDGRLLVAAFRGHVIAVDVATGGVIATAAYPDGTIPRQVQPSANGDAVWIVLAKSSGWRRVEAMGWEKRSLPRLEREDGSTGEERVLAFRPDGARLSCTGGRIVLFEGAGERVLAEDYADAGVIAPNGTYAATMFGFSNTVRGWDLAAGTQVEQFELPIGGRLSCTIYYERVALAELSAALPYDVTHREGTYRRDTSDVALASDRRHVVIVSAHGADVWDLETRARVRRLWETPSNSVAISPDGTLAAIGVGASIRLVGIAAPLRPHVPWAPVEATRADPAAGGRVAHLVDVAAIDPVAALAELGELFARNPALRVNFAINRRLHRTIAPFAIPRAAMPRFARAISLPKAQEMAFAFDANATRLVVSLDSQVQFHDLESGEVAHAIELGAARVPQLGNGERWLLAREAFRYPQPIGPPSTRYAGIVFEVASGKEIGRLPDQYTDLAIHPHLPVIVASSGRQLLIFDGDLTRPARTGERSEQFYHRIAFCADGALLVARNSDGALLCDGTTGAELHFFRRGAHVGGPAGAIAAQNGRAIAFDPRTGNPGGTELIALAGGRDVTRHDITVRHLGAQIAIATLPPSWRPLVLADARTLAPLHEPVDLGDWGLVAVSRDGGLFVLYRDQVELWTIDYQWSFLEDVIDDRIAVLADTRAPLAAHLDAWSDLQRLAARPGVGAEALARVARARDRVIDAIRNAEPGPLPIELAVRLVDPTLA